MYSIVLNEKVSNKAPCRTSVKLNSGESVIAKFPILDCNVIREIRYAAIVINALLVIPGGINAIQNIISGSTKLRTKVIRVGDGYVLKRNMVLSRGINTSPLRPSLSVWFAFYKHSYDRQDPGQAGQPGGTVNTLHV